MIIAAIRIHSTATLSEAIIKFLRPISNIARKVSLMVRCSQASQGLLKDPASSQKSRHGFLLFLHIFGV